MDEVDVSTAYFIIHSISLFGFVSNFVASVTIYKKRDLHNPFGILCATMALNNVFVLTMNSIWYALPDDEIFIYASTLSRIIGYVDLTMFNFGCKLHVFIAMNRMFAVIIPMRINALWTNSRTFIGLIFVLLLTFLQNVPMLLYNDVWFCYDRPLMTWRFAETERGQIFENKFNIIPTILDFALTIAFDLITLFSLRFIHSKSKHINSKNSRKRDIEIRLFVQAFSQSLPVIILYHSFIFLTPTLNNNFTRFLSTTVVWHFAHGIDGLIIDIFHTRMKLFRKKKMRKQLSLY